MSCVAAATTSSEGAPAPLLPSPPAPAPAPAPALVPIADHGGSSPPTRNLPPSPAMTTAVSPGFVRSCRTRPARSDATCHVVARPARAGSASTRRATPGPGHDRRTSSPSPAIVGRRRGSRDAGASSPDCSGENARPISTTATLMSPAAPKIRLRARSTSCEAPTPRIPRTARSSWAHASSMEPTTMSAKPLDIAVGASKASPVSIQRRHCCRLRRRRDGTDTTPGRAPRRTSGNANVASSVATTTSAIAGNNIPTPCVTPRQSTTTGNTQSSTSRSWNKSSVAPLSPPTQKFAHAVVNTCTRAGSSAARISSIIDASKASSRNSTHVTNVPGGVEIDTRPLI